MTVDSALQGARSIYLDTAPIIYWVESHSDYLAKMTYIVDFIASQQLQVVTSVITLTEVLIQPLRLGNAELVETYRELVFSNDRFDIVSISLEIAESAALLRARYNLSMQDALHAASARLHRCDAFLTNDSDFRRVQDLNALVLNDMEL